MEESAEKEEEWQLIPVQEKGKFKEARFNDGGSKRVFQNNSDYDKVCRFQSNHEGAHKQGGAQSEELYSSESRENVSEFGDYPRRLNLCRIS
jgi:hypothetical protein